MHGLPGRTGRDVGRGACWPCCCGEALNPEGAAHGPPPPSKARGRPGFRVVTMMRHRVVLKAGWRPAHGCRPDQHHWVLQTAPAHGMGNTLVFSSSAPAGKRSQRPKDYSLSTVSPD